MLIPLKEAIHRLQEGDIVAVPTETVYGLGASINCPNAIDKIFTLKGRPQNNPLIIHLASAQEIAPFILDPPKDLDQLTKSFWPGPLTLVLPIKEKTILSKVRAGLPTCAFRVPNNPWALKLLKETGPLVMPSANLSGKPSATTPSHVENDFGKNFPVLQEETNLGGIESTILIYKTQWTIIREGAITREMLGEILGYPPPIDGGSKERPLCPGQRYRHYAPKAKLYLSKNIPEDPVEAVIGFSDRSYPNYLKQYILGSSNDPVQAAKSLYSILRQLDQDQIHSSWVDTQFPKNSLWATIRQRLQKASLPTSSLIVLNEPNLSR